MISKHPGTSLLIAAALIVMLAVLLAPRVSQPASCHHFADQREWLGVPRFGDVTSNLPFAVIGLWGLAFLAGRGSARAFTDPRERCPYFLASFGLLLTALGSAYYHLAPDNARLVCDRLPMTVVFMALVAAMIAERVSVALGLWLLPLLLALGVASVLQWYRSELRGVGDLRFYAAVQVLSMMVLLVALLLPPRYTRGTDLAVVASFYVLAKALESSDRIIFSVGHTISGHTLKHLAAAAAGYWILRMLQRRKPISCPVPAHS
jgi:hypothetical protein